jgi:hypothetical protein
MHDDRSAPQRARATCSYLVVGDTRVRSRRTDWLFAKIWLVTVDILVEGHVKKLYADGQFFRPTLLHTMENEGY